VAALIALLYLQEPAERAAAVTAVPGSRRWGHREPSQPPRARAQRTVSLKACHSLPLLTPDAVTARAPCRGGTSRCSRRSRPQEHLCGQQPRGRPGHVRPGRGAELVPPQLCRILCHAVPRLRHRPARCCPTRALQRCPGRPQPISVQSTEQAAAGRRQREMAPSSAW